MKVLLADDNEYIKILLKEFLTSKGYEVVMVGSGQEFIDVMESTAVDLIMMDTFLVEFSHRHIMDYLRGSQCKVPVIFMTGGNARIRGVPVLKKPFRLEVLEDMIQSVIA